MLDYHLSREDNWLLELSPRTTQSRDDIEIRPPPQQHYLNLGDPFVRWFSNDVAIRSLLRNATSRARMHVFIEVLAFTPKDPHAFRSTDIRLGARYSGNSHSW